MAVESAQAGVRTVEQSIDAGIAAIEAAEASVAAAEASVWRSQRDAERLRNIKREDDGAVFRPPGGAG